MANNYLQFSFEIEEKDPVLFKDIEEILTSYKENEDSMFDFDVDRRLKKFLIYAEEYGQLDTMEYMLKDILTMPNSKRKAIGFQFSYTCSKMRTDEFGGGAMIVTIGGAEYFTSEAWLHDKLSKNR